MSKEILHKKARILRKRGLSIKTIAKKLEVSSSTVSLWCRDIKLTKEQSDVLMEKAHNPYYGRRKDNILRQIKKRLDNIEQLKQEGIKEVATLSQRDLFVIGVALYWAEGFKKDKRLGFANSDPAMIKLFLKWLTENCKVPVSDIRLRVGLNISHKYRIDTVVSYWSRITNIPIVQFQKPYFQKFKWKKVFPNPEAYFGVLRIRANKKLSLFRKINGWIEGLKMNI
jgi:transcriptional regulator with XRE-family HTH domain